MSENNPEYRQKISSEDSNDDKILANNNFYPAGLLKNKAAQLSEILECNCHTDVLLVDDDEFCLESLKMIMDLKNIKSIKAKSGA